MSRSRPDALRPDGQRGTARIGRASDRVGERRVEVAGQVVAHPVDEQQLGAGDRAGGRPPAGDVHHPVGEPWTTSRRDPQPAQPGGRGWAGPGSPCIWRSTPLAETPRSKVSPARASASSRGTREARGSRSARHILTEAGGVRLAAAAARRDQHGQQPRVLPADRALPGRRHDAGERRGPARGGRWPSSGRSCRPSTRRRRGRRRARGGRAARSASSAMSSRVYGGRTGCPAKARTSAVRVTRWSLSRRGAAGVAVVVADDVEAARARASGRARGPTRSSGRRAPSPAAAARRRGRRRSGSRARCRGRPGRRAPRRPTTSCWRLGVRGHAHDTYRSVRNVTRGV